MPALILGVPSKSLAAIVAHAFFDLRSLVLIPWIVLRVHKKPGPRPPTPQSQKTSA